MLENPIRRIVNLLQKMQEVAEEGERDKDLNEKFICYCEKNDGELQASTEELRNKIPQIEASIKEPLDADLARHKSDRQAAKESIDTATKQREKEADAFAEESGELKSNIAALKKASDAIAKGMSGSFLQSSAANTLRQIAVDNLNLSRYQRDTLTSFLSTNTGYAPASGEILGILRQLQEDMEKELKEITETENAAISEFEGLVAAKEKEIAAATEDKTQRAGETAVQIVQLQNDLADAKDELGADEAFLMELKKSCATKAKEYEERKEMRAQEAVALAETIKILNDDDALDLFKKTLPSPSLLRLAKSAAQTRAEAAQVLRSVKVSKFSPKLSLIAMALEGKKVGFEKVLKMIDEMVATLKVEQTDDEAQLKWCNAEFDKNEDETKETKRLSEGLASKIEETNQGIQVTTDEIAALKKSIKDTDEAVAEATEQRKEEHAVFVQTNAENNAAVQLLEVAKNRMNKFYNPALYKKPVRRELTEEERIYVQSGGADPRDAEEAAVAGTGIAGTGIAVFTQLKLKSKDAPPPPETVDAYSKKDASGPTALIDKLKNDLEKEVQAAEFDEKEAQKDYEEFMADSVKKRATDSKSITEKDSQKAEL